jgi:hypothetical protein
MRRTMLVLCALLVTTTFGCERVKTQLSGMREGVAGLRARVGALVGRFHHKAAAPMPVVPLHPVTLRPALHPVAPPHPVAPAPAPPRAPGTVAHDVPYVSPDTGTLTPGMSERDVYSLWGPPIAVRRAGEYTYLFFRNGCEHRCGTEDVVTLDNGQVVSAIVRWPGHNFLGGSSPVTPAPSATPQMPAGSATDSIPVKTTVPADSIKTDSTHGPGATD